MMKKSALKSADLSHPDVCLRFACRQNVATDVAGFCYLEWKLPCKKRCANQGFSQIDRVDYSSHSLMCLQIVIRRQISSKSENCGC